MSSGRPQRRLKPKGKNSEKSNLRWQKRDRSEGRQNSGENPEVTQSQVWHCARGKTSRRRPDTLAREEPLEIRVRGTAIVVTMRTPGHDDELAAGFLLGERVVESASDITAIGHCLNAGIEEAGNVINVFLSPAVRFDLGQLQRNVFASSSCGICGKASIGSVHQHFPAVGREVRFRRALLWELSAQLHAAQATFTLTGGNHAAAIFDQAGRLQVLREDVGRHNAVDKVIGHFFLKGVPASEHILMVSGRASFEIMQKSLAARIPMVCAISAPSSLAVEFAQASGQTLVGFLREDTLNVYSHPERLGLK